MQPSATNDKNLRASRVSLSAYSMGSLEEGSKFLWVSLVSSTAVSLSGAVSILQPGLSASSLTHTPARLTECESARIKLSQLRHHSRADLGEDFAKSFGKRSCSKSCLQLLLFQYEIDVPLKCLSCCCSTSATTAAYLRPSWVPDELHRHINGFTRRGLVDPSLPEYWPLVLLSLDSRLYEKSCDSATHALSGDSQNSASTCALVSLKTLKLTNPTTRSRMLRAPSLRLQEFAKSGTTQTKVPVIINGVPASRCNSLLEVHVTNVNCCLRSVKCFSRGKAVPAPWLIFSTSVLKGKRLSAGPENLPLRRLCCNGSRLFTGS